MTERFTRKIQRKSSGVYCPESGLSLKDLRPSDPRAFLLDPQPRFPPPVKKTHQGLDSGLHSSTYFEGQAGEIPIARRGYSRDHRPDALQIILALVVTEEGFPLSYEVFEGNRADVTTLEEILDLVERKHGALSRVWIFDRGIVSEENLALLRRRGASYLVATPRRMLGSFQKELVKEDWSEVKAHPQIQVKLVERDGELYVLSRSLNRAEKERAMRMRALHGLRKDLAKLSKSVRSGRWDVGN